MGDNDGENSDIEDEPLIRSLELNFSGWNIGGKLIFIATVIAILSLLLPWIGENGEAELGYQQGASIFLAFYIYPFLILAQDKTMNKVVGIASSALAASAPMILVYHLSREMALRMLDIVNWGVILFLLASITLLVGVIKYERYLREGEEPKKLVMLKKKRGKPCPECDSAMVYEEEWDRWYCEECEKYR